MIEVLSAQTEDELDAVRFLFLAHAAALRVHPGSEVIRVEAGSLPQPYIAPRGRIYLARLDGMPAGCVALKPFEATIGEVKRMFVLSTARRHGVGRSLMERLLSDARQMGYQSIRLGTLQEMTAAHALYRELGFVEIPRYRPDEMIDTTFFECSLTRSRWFCTSLSNGDAHHDAPMGPPAGDPLSSGRRRRPIQRCGECRPGGVRDQSRVPEQGRRADAGG